MSSALNAKASHELREPEVVEILHRMIEMGINPVLKLYGRSIGEFFTFLGKRGDLMAVYISNQQTRAEVLADEIVDIADHEASFDRAKIKISARQWFSSRILHRKYGDKLSVEHTQTVDLRGSIQEAKRRAGLLGPDASKLAIPVLSMPMGDENYDEKKDRSLAARTTGINVPPPHQEEDLPSWGERVVEGLPLMERTIPLEDELDEDGIDIFS